MTIDLNALAEEAHEALSTATAIPTFSSRAIIPTVGEAYQAIAHLRVLRDEAVVGRKIGFTNRNIWPQYDIHQPIWGDVTAATLLGDGPVRLAPFVEPRLEPEIVLGLSHAPSPGMDETALATCIDWIAPGFEVVQSIYPGWRFQTADTILAGGLHGGLLVGDRVAASPERLAALTGVTITLARDGRQVDQGVGANALDGPMSALRHLNDLLADDDHNPPLGAGEIVTTGTLTDAWPIRPGEVWSARYQGVLDAEISIRFT